MQIELKDVSFSYDPKKRRPAGKLPPYSLRGIHLSVDRPEMIAVAGRSGSGKTTLLHLLKGFLKPNCGKLLLQGKEPWTARRTELFDEIGIVFQYPEHQLFAATVYDDIAFGPKNQLSVRGDSSAVRERVKEAMDHVGLDMNTYGERSPLELSGGEKRRVALAGVLALKPKLLLLDEPTAGLDLHSRKRLFELLSGLPQKQGVPVIWVSHSLIEILANATRLLWMEEGTIIRDGAPKEILADAAFLRQMNVNLPECLSLQNKLIAEGFRGIERPWEAAGMAIAMMEHVKRSTQADKEVV